MEKKKKEDAVSLSNLIKRWDIADMIVFLCSSLVKSYYPQHKKSQMIPDDGLLTAPNFFKSAFY